MAEKLKTVKSHYGAFVSLKQPIFEIITIGNELLTGKTLNTNAHWLAKRITNLGGRVSRIVVVRDDVKEIRAAVNGALAREPSFIITSGGLGPTFDDKTLEGISEAINKPLQLNKQAYNMIKEKYLSYHEAGLLKKFELTPPRMKMAKLPVGSRPLRNPVGTAPGVLLKYKGTTLIALPGVPTEMKGMFEGVVVKLIRSCIKNVFTYKKSLRVTGVVESEIAPLIDATMRENPHVYIKSHPKAAEPNPLIELFFTTTSGSEELSKEMVEKAMKQISKRIIEHGGSVELMVTQNSDMAP